MSGEKHRLIVDYDHVARVLAERARVGVGYLHDVREAFKARIKERRNVPR